MSPDERRSQLLREGLALFDQRSHDEVSIDDIAAAAGISRGLLYHYFPTKRDYVLAVLRMAIDELTEQTAPDPALDAEAQVNASIAAFLDYVREHAQGYATLFRTRGGGDAAVRELLEAGRARRLEFILEGIALLAGRPLEELRTPVLEAAAQGWMFFTEGVVLRWLEQGEVTQEQVHGLMRLALGDVMRLAEGAVRAGAR